MQMRMILMSDKINSLFELCTCVCTGGGYECVFYAVDASFYANKHDTDDDKEAAVKE
jgi:hypothetical protein